MSSDLRSYSVDRCCRPRRRALLHSNGDNDDGCTTTTVTTHAVVDVFAPFGGSRHRDG